MQTAKCDIKVAFETKKPKIWLKSVSAFGNGIKVGLYAGNDQPSNKPTVPSYSATFEDFTYKVKGGEAELVSFGRKAELEVMGLDLVTEGKKEYKKGETFDPSGYTFTAYYTDKTTETISGEDCEVTGFHSNQAGTQKVVFTYQGKSVSVEVFAEGYLKLDRWEVINEDLDYWTINSENSLTVTTQEGGIYTNSKNTANNEFMIEADRDFEVSVKLTFTPEADYQAAGLLILGDENPENAHKARSYVGLWRRFHSGYGKNVLNMLNYNGRLGETDIRPDTSVDEPIWLKLVKDGDTVTSYISMDGSTWEQLGKQENALLNSATTLKVGVYAGNDKSIAPLAPNSPAIFENFTYQVKDGEAEVVSFGRNARAELTAFELRTTGKTQYVKGDEFNPSGYRFTAYYTDGTTKTIAGRDCEVTGFDPQQEGTQTVTFTYQGESVSVEVNVSADPIESIREDLKAAVNELKEELAGLNREDYTRESWDKLEAAISKAEAVAEDVSATAVMLETMKAELTAARDGLEKAPVIPEPDPTEAARKELKAVIEKLKEELAGLNRGDYTQESWNKLEAAIKKAETVAEDAEATVPMLETMTGDLETAREGLEEVREPEPEPDPTVEARKELKAAIDKLKEELAGLNREDYTQESWNSLEAALKQAEELVGNENATVQLIEAIMKNLADVRARLEKVPEPTPDPVPTPDSGSGSGSGSSSSASAVSNSGVNAVTGTWTLTEEGIWQFTSGGRQYMNEWAAVAIPGADASKGQETYAWYRFDEKGNMITGWFTDTDGAVYYFQEEVNGSEGRMMTGWVQIKDADGNMKWYYFNPVSDGTRGKLLVNTTTPDGYRVDENGVWIEVY